MDVPGEQAHIDEVTEWIDGALPRRARVVDLGCGSGAYLHALSQRGFEVVGVDFAPKMLQQARELCADQRGRVSFEMSDLNAKLPFADGVFDGALCVYAMQYLSDPAPFLGEVARVLRTGGQFVIGVPAVEWVPTGDHLQYRGFERLMIRLRAQVTRVPGIVSRFSYPQLEALVRAHGFEPVEHRPHPGGHGVLVEKAQTA